MTGSALVQISRVSHNSAPIYTHRLPPEERLTFEQITKVKASKVAIEGREIVVTLADGKKVVAPADAFARLQSATDEQLQAVELTHMGQGLRWEALDEDISVRGLARDFGIRCG